MSELGQLMMYVPLPDYSIMLGTMSILYFLTFIAKFMVLESLALTVPLNSVMTPLPNAIATVLGLFCILVYILKKPSPDTFMSDLYNGMSIISGIYFIFRILLFMTPKFMSTLWPVLFGFIAQFAIYIMIDRKLKKLVMDKNKH